MRISDWSSDVCSSDLVAIVDGLTHLRAELIAAAPGIVIEGLRQLGQLHQLAELHGLPEMLRQIDLFAALAKCRDQLGAAFLHLRIGGVPGRLPHEGAARAQQPQTDGAGKRWTLRVYQWV